MNKITRKSIFMDNFESKVAYYFTRSDLKELEEIIDFYEKQLKQKDEVINKTIKQVKELQKQYEEEDYEYKELKSIEDILNKYKGDNNE